MFTFAFAGYARIVLAVVSFYYMPSNYVVAVWCYVVSALLDAFDGHAARHFNQSTKFGAMLDQLTDRCGTMCLLVTLSHFYPKYMFWFQLSMTIDIACHWLYLHTTTLQGKKVGFTLCETTDFQDTSRTFGSETSMKIKA